MTYRARCIGHRRRTRSARRDLVAEFVRAIADIDAQLVAFEEEMRTRRLEAGDEPFLCYPPPAYCLGLVR